MCQLCMQRNNERNKDLDDEFDDLLTPDQFLALLIHYLNEVFEGVFLELLSAEAYI